MAAGAFDVEELYGTWRLVASKAVDAAGNPKRDPWGPEPMGILALDRNGRMMAALIDGRQSPPRDRPRSYSSYSGTFVIEGNLLTTTIDAASDARRIGSKQPRELEFRDGHLVLRPPPRADGERREIFWERANAQ